MLIASLVALALGACSSTKPDDPKRLFSRYCARCHGEDGRGQTPRFAHNPRLDLTDDLWIHTRPEADGLAALIRRGVGEMPSFRGLEDRQIELLAAHVRTLSGS